MIDFLNALNDLMWGKPFIIFVMMVGLIFTLQGGFFTISRFGHIMKHTLGSLTSKEANKKEAGRVSPFEAVCVAIGGTVGAANIGGVATAIATGGPGAVFWMWLWAFFGMMVKLVETTLGCYYRSQDEKGNYYGGSMYFMEKGIGREQGKKAGFVLAGIFSLCFLLQAVQGSQAYTISEVLYAAFGFDMILVTCLYTVLVYFVIWRGTPRIAKIATKAVPFMCLIYLIGGLAIIGANITSIPGVFVLIFREAFTGSAAFGGFIGATVAKAMNAGVSRSMNSNEAGMGSSPLIHGSADTIHPMRQGLWGAFEVFIDTIVVCSITALSILCTGAYQSGSAGATLTIEAFTSVFGNFAASYIGIMVLLFGFTTTAGWYVYYVTVIGYALRHQPVIRDKIINIFKIMFPMMNVIIVSYIVLTGSGADLFWTIVSIVTAPSVFINLIALLFLRKKFFAIFKDYQARYLGKGKVDPQYYVFYEDDPAIAEKEEAIREEIRRKNHIAYTG